MHYSKIIYVSHSGNPQMALNIKYTVISGWDSHISQVVEAIVLLMIVCVLASWLRDLAYSNLQRILRGVQKPHTSFSKKK